MFSTVANAENALILNINQGQKNSYPHIVDKVVNKYLTVLHIVYNFLFDYFVFYFEIDIMRFITKSRT